ncbi:hypothetical protein ACOSP7_003902 [Xanthoceras sorbifolium]
MEDPQGGGAVTGYPVHVPTAYSRPTATVTATAATATATDGEEDVQKMINICFFVSLIMTILVCSMFPAVMEVITYTRPPFKSPEFEIHSLSVRPINIYSSHITGEWGTRVAVINPNKGNYRIHYQEIEAEIFYKQCHVTSKRMIPVLDDGIEFLEETFDVCSEFVGRLCANSIETDWSQRGKTNFTLILRSVVKNIFVPVLFESWPSRKITAKCKEIEVEFSSNMTMGSMVGDFRVCDVKTQTILSG